MSNISEEAQAEFVLEMRTRFLKLYKEYSLLSNPYVSLNSLTDLTCVVPAPVARAVTLLALKSTCHSFDNRSKVYSTYKNAEGVRVYRTLQRNYLFINVHVTLVLREFEKFYTETNLMRDY